MIFDITVNQVLDPDVDFEKVSDTIQTLYPNLRCYSSKEVLADNTSVDLNVAYTWFDIEETLDTEHWTHVIHFHIFPELNRTNNFPQIGITEQVSKSFNCDCLCDGDTLGNLVSNLNVYDPYWTLAYIKQQWFFADTAGMKLMGPYTDGVTETPGDAKLQLLYQLDLKNPTERMYDYNDFKVYGS